MLSSSKIQARATNIGNMLQHLAPSLSSFRFQCSDCHALFQPIDYVIFEGLCKGRVSKIIFADIKTGKSRLTHDESEIKGLVGRKKVDFDVYEANR